MFRSKRDRGFRTFACLLSLIFLVTACGAKDQTASPGPLQQQLRVSNTGSTNIKDLVIVFPGLNSEMEAVKLEFGDLPAGQTSEYLDAPTGVYRYGAYTYTLEGSEVLQPVTDWVGEGPIAGQKFTYQVNLALNKPVGSQIRLIKVVVDEP